MEKKDQDNPVNLSLMKAMPHLLPILFPDFQHLIPFTPEEVKTTLRKTIRREADLILLYQLPQNNLILHIEIQETDNADFSYRNLIYFSLIKEKFRDKTIVQMVVYTGEEKPVYVGKSLPLPGGGAYTYQVVNLRLKPLSAYQHLDNLIAYCFAAASVKEAEELTEFFDKFVRLSDTAGKEELMLAFNTVEGLMLHSSLKYFKAMFKTKSAPKNTLWNSLVEDIKKEYLTEIRQEALQEVKQEARQEARQEALLEGEEIGQQKKAIETVENCIKKGLEIKLIAEITGFSEEEVMEIAKRFRKG